MQPRVVCLTTNWKSNTPVVRMPEVGGTCADSACHPNLHEMTL
jgi:hypothetical protein